MCYVKYYASSLGILVSTASMMIFTAGRMIPAIMSLFMRVMAALYVWIINSPVFRQATLLPQYPHHQILRQNV